MTTKLVRYEVDVDNPPPLTDAQREELARLAAMRDEDIDFSDIPAATDGADAIRFRDRRLYRPVKKQVTLRLDADVIQWFKSHPEGREGYQTRINRALRRYVEDEERKAGIGAP